MCGIWAYFNKNNIEQSEMTKKVMGFRSKVKKIRHRGPDWSGSYQAPSPNQIYIAHERLAINGVESGSQPIQNTDLGLILSVNGEIYNHQTNDVDLKDMGYQYLTKSDCECIMYLYAEAISEYESKTKKDIECDFKEFITEFLNKIDGIFTFVLYDYKRNIVVVARDPIGVNSLYYGFNEEGTDIFICSEMKGLDDVGTVKIFPPGQAMWFMINYDQNVNITPVFTQYYNPKWKTNLLASLNEDDSVSESKIAKDNEIVIANKIRNSLIYAVYSQLMTEVPFGVLLSGGLDSSLIAAIAQKMLNKGMSREWGDKIHTFSIGLEDSPDMKAAAKVAEHIGSIHHGFVFTLQEAEDALEDVIYHLETYDITTIRASTPMFLLSRRIKAMGIKMVLSGEGSDEIFGGYLYFHHAPTPKEFQEECGALINRLHYSDCLRANKSTMAWGLEARVPFLDLKFLESAIPVSPKYKIASRTPDSPRIEKYILRKAFADEVAGENYLPEELLWRQKEQFSDGVGYNWIDHLKKITSERVSDDEVEGSGMNKEAYYYMQIYKRLFPNRQGIIPRWKPRTDWQGITSEDPSGRAVKVHEKAI
jgi:asparagine synthase (glutamine-hydrolysing)